MSVWPPFEPHNDRCGGGGEKQLSTHAHYIYTVTLCTLNIIITCAIFMNYYILLCIYSTLYITYMKGYLRGTEGKY